MRKRERVRLLTVKCDLYFSLQDSTASATGPNSSTPLKDSTPTNQGEALGSHWDHTGIHSDVCCSDVSESQDITTEEDHIEVETGAAAGASSSSSLLVPLGNIPEGKDIVESSDC